jgi:LuxR family transcriptional regulator, maltose regulon positive regulatory protein
MVEPVAETRPAGGPGEPDALLATKLHPPSLRPGFVPRPRLVERLGEGLASALTLVCAAAGFGKTALLADWARRSPAPVAWLSLDAGDNDPARFWRYAAAALARLRPAVGERLTVLLEPPGWSVEAVVTALVNELAAEPDPVVLVLDDYHLIETPAVHDSVGLLVDRLPSGLRLVIAGRADPPLALARLRARGQLTELRATDLRFTPEEAAAFLGEAWRLDLPSGTVAALTARTEGWAAGLQLAALSLQGRPDPETFVRDFTGTHRFVLDYLSIEVLERQPHRVRAFLLQTSILDRLSGPLCDAVTGGADGQRLLAEVEAANLFLVRLDEGGRWFRYHQLFAELLQARLRQDDPGQERELHRRAAGWCQANGLIDEAVRHAIGAGELEWATRLAEQHVEELVLGRGEQVTIDRWLSALPAEVVRSRPRLWLVRSMSALVAGRLDEAELLLDLAEDAPGDRHERHDPSVGRSASIMANVAAATAVLRAQVALVRGDAAAERTYAGQAAAHLTADDRVLGTFPAYHLAIADWLDGRVDEAEPGLAAVLADRLAIGEPYLASWAAYDLGQVQRAQGRLRAALRTHRRALELLAATAKPPRAVVGTALVGLAEVELQRGQLAEALDHATEGVGLCRHQINRAPLASGLATLAWLRQLTGDPAGSLEAIAEAEQAVPNREVAAVLNPAIPARGRLLLAHGDLAGAQRWVEERGLTEEDEPAYPREPEHLVLARLLLANGAGDRALRLLGRLAVAARAQGRTGSLIEIAALQALARQASGDHDEASAALGQALGLGWPEGYVRVFADEGTPMAGLLRRLVASRRRGQPPTGPAVPLDYLGRILRASAPTGERPPPPGEPAAAVAGLVEPLTDRELEVLRLLATGRRNQQIADELVVSAETVKKHLAHIYQKLGASNRTQAIANARGLGLTL